MQEEQALGSKPKSIQIANFQKQQDRILKVEKD
jgi:hypothetical protein